MKRFNLMPQNSESPYMDAPVRLTREGSKDKELVVVSIPIIIALVLVYFLHVMQKPEMATGTNVVQTKKLEMLKKEYETLVLVSKEKADVNALLQERNKLQTNLDTIKSLNLVKSIPLDLLVAIGRNISEKLALTAISKKEEIVSLEGIARDNKSLSDFMDILVNQNVFKNISVKITEYSDDYGPYKQKFTLVGIL
ncbi:MAG: PilN domain-containing protein [Proteobacteria bacterium]|nr:PilN domain-containing protein [Pseudomonadota bacterium]